MASGSADHEDLRYRQCAGVMLANREGLVFAAQRIDSKNLGAWQMPQGGIDPGETQQEAAMRELEEETGVSADLADVIARMPYPVRYDLPEELQGKLWGGRYRGQEQHWFLARFTGTDADIDIAAHNPPEFSEWKWVEPDELPRLIVPFKREVYRAVVKEFRSLI
ncbi:RNA pyrophosphohydrolase [Erythrobacter litoralis]|uniref:RNA pyrophosphohydrolase n=1 Tax=Erythrobacter litoralis (strain HTCC2594) TaxID=314225 RepID=RPPH_ERYLH|nr:RNA pyrophosphohydrolase [Erythrobacter litoralis]Q2N9Y3.1 RecName: Full=RNA pyrophosphohydrolase; AltName: Full=(Di)nucleoside polyphosphate hydrolase [Erythrobacter litoralis HTCC2594]ABC63508.1 hydrolase, NUDIX family, NudH subfamily [Erythrobacter litoralis HTCC2594]